MTCALAWLLVAWVAAFVGFLAGSWARGLKQVSAPTLPTKGPQ